jgi:hypothetical protein
MLKGRQKKLDRNKDGKISGEDFKMMKAKYGKMSKAKDGKIIKAGLGTMAQDLVRKVFGKNKAVAKTGSNMGAMSFKGKKLPIETLVQKATEQNKAKSGKMMKANKGMEAKSTQGYGAARTSGMGLQDESLKSGQNYEITKGGDYIKDLI